jgi:hypothetical protein
MECDWSSDVCSSDLLLGQEVAVLADGVRAAGEHTVSFNAANLSSGMYIYRLSSGNEVVTRKMLLVK